MFTLTTTSRFSSTHASVGGQHDRVGARGNTYGAIHNRTSDWNTRHRPSPVKSNRTRARSTSVPDISGCILSKGVPNFHAIPPIGAPVLEGLRELAQAGFKRGVVYISDGLLGDEITATPEFYHDRSSLNVFKEAPLSLEAHVSMRSVSAKDVEAYFAYFRSVTLQLESFWTEEGWGIIDVDIFLECIRTASAAGGRIGIAVYPSTPVNCVAEFLHEKGYLQYVSHFTIFMGGTTCENPFSAQMARQVGQLQAGRIPLDHVPNVDSLSSTMRQWRYMPAMERKVTELRQLLSSLESNFTEIVGIGAFDTFSISFVARTGVDSIVITDIERYKFVDDDWTDLTSMSDSRKASKLIEMPLYGRTDRGTAKAVYSDAIHRSFAARNIVHHLERQMANGDCI